MCRQHSMRVALVDLESAVLQKLYRLERGGGDRDDLVVITMHDECRHRDSLEIFRLVSLREGLDAIVMGLGRANHALAPPVLDHTRIYLSALAVEAVERSRGHVEEELGPVVGDTLAKTVEHLDRQAFRIPLSLEHQRWKI